MRGWRSVVELRKQTSANGAEAQKGSPRPRTTPGADLMAAPLGEFSKSPQGSGPAGMGQVYSTGKTFPFKRTVRPQAPSQGFGRPMPSDCWKRFRGEAEARGHAQTTRTFVQGSTGAGECDGVFAYMA